MQTSTVIWATRPYDCSSDLLPKVCALETFCDSLKVAVSAGDKPQKGPETAAGSSTNQLLPVEQPQRVRNLLQRTLQIAA